MRYLTFISEQICASFSPSKAELSAVYDEIVKEYSFENFDMVQTPVSLDPPSRYVLTYPAHDPVPIRQDDQQVEGIWWRSLGAY